MRVLRELPQRFPERSRRLRNCDTRKLPEALERIRHLGRKATRVAAVIHDHGARVVLQERLSRLAKHGEATTETPVFHDLLDVPGEALVADRQRYEALDNARPNQGSEGKERVAWEHLREEIDEGFNRGDRKRKCAPFARFLTPCPNVVAVQGGIGSRRQRLIGCRSKKWLEDRGSEIPCDCLEVLVAQAERGQSVPRVPESRALVEFDDLR